MDIGYHIKRIFVNKKTVKFASRALRKKKIDYNVDFPLDAVECEYLNLENKEYKKIAIVAGFTINGEIPDHTIYYLKKIKEIFDGTILIYDSPIKKKEINKIKNLVIYASFQRHKQYDFGSYKIGYRFLVARNLRDNLEQILLTNDSCFGPVYDLKEVFNKMDKENYDIWGLLGNKSIKKHIQSWFLVINKNIFKTDYMENFFAGVKKEDYFFDVVVNYEIEFSSHLMSKYHWGTYIPINTKDKELKTHSNKTLLGDVLLKNYRFPFVKVKTFTYFYTKFFDRRREVMKIIKKDNQELYNYIVKYLNENNFETSFLSGI